MKQDLIDILAKIKNKFTDNSDLAWTRYTSAKEARDEIDSCIEQLNNDDITCLEKINILFLPTASFQEHSMQNNWEEEYLELSEQFDDIYIKMKTNG